MNAPIYILLQGNATCYLIDSVTAGPTHCRQTVVHDSAAYVMQVKGASTVDGRTLNNAETIEGLVEAVESLLDDK